MDESELLALRRRNAIQTFQPLFCVRAHCAKRRSVEIAHLIAAGDAACKRIFVHAAVQAKIHLLNRSLNMRFCRRHGILCSCDFVQNQASGPSHR